MENLVKAQKADAQCQEWAAECELNNQSEFRTVDH